MILYHGSNVAVETPKIRENLRALDFGAGFYLTSNRTQAIKWAKIVTKRRSGGFATLSVFNLDENIINELSVLKFDEPSGDWLDFVVDNRQETYNGIKYDLVVGPIANDSTLVVIDNYMDGTFTKEYAISRLLPQNLTDQYAFLSNKGIAALQFQKSEVM